MEKYSLNEDTYIIRNYDKLPPFSSFLPGLTGIRGIPLWVFYTNRGQGINSFGIHNKNNAIMEFNPANTAYENTSTKGFRTFLKYDGRYYEPFFTLGEQYERNFYIKKNSIKIEDINPEAGIRITVDYFVLPKESIGALVREVKVENIGTKKISVELLDGMPKLIPYGMLNQNMKEMSNLLKSWTEIKNVENNVPYYTMRSSSEDSAEVSEINGGYFYTAISEGKPVPVIYDPELVFRYDNSLIHPIGFEFGSAKELLEQTQYYVNKIPCAFSVATFELEKEECSTITSLIGYADSPAQVNEKLKMFCQPEYILQKKNQADEIIAELTRDVKTHTAIPLFDQYMEQCYMDNFLRGGYPFVIGDGADKAVIHLFSRKHGDPERDYNFFSIAGEYYSQGNGNFRDVNQNRRNDVFFHREIDDFNIKTFFQLVQIDGYNPLEVRPSTFTVKEEHRDVVNDILKQQVKEDYPKLQKIVEGNFTPGQISNCIARDHIFLECEEEELLQELLKHCNQNIEAGLVEGYWSDHWSYHMDLIDNYLMIYPDREQTLLFHDKSYRYYDSAARVMPRSVKYVLAKNGPRQYGAFAHDEEKAARKDFHKKGTNWLKTKSGSFVQTTLMVKLISLALNKFSILDPYGMGIEMEGGKPGWNDAMNGLPGLFGSGMAESFELKRLIDYIKGTVLLEQQITMPVELCDFMLKLITILNASYERSMEDFLYWDKVASVREDFRDTVRFELSGEECVVNTIDIFQIFDKFSRKLDQGIQKACSFGNGIVPTYFIYQAAEYEVIQDANGTPIASDLGLPNIRVKKFEVEPMPAFLEGPAKLLGILGDQEEAKLLYAGIRNSDIFDEELGMYKISGSLEQQSMEAGRIRAFTPGWLERESIFLHMEYKYLLSLLRAGLYEEFYRDLRNALIPFLDPKRYGRSILENSSFLASSVNPDPGVRGRGFVARLSGSTTEMLTMWIEMFIGRKVFTYEQGELVLNFEPKLPEWMFDEKAQASFTLLNSCTVTYINPSRKATYGENEARITKIVLEELGEVVHERILSGRLAHMVRNHEIKNITVYLE